MSVGYFNGIPRDNLTGILVGASSGSNGSALTYVNQSSCQLSIAGSSVTGAGTYTIQEGYYTQIGNMIFLQAKISWSAHTGSGNLLITGLPFAVSSATNYTPEGLVNTVNIPLPAGANRTAIASTSPGSTSLSVVVATDSSSNTAVALPSSGEVHLTLTYST